MFQLTTKEFEILRSQSMISRRGGRRFRPYALTEHGVAMLSSVLRGTKATQVNIEIIRTFVQMRRMLEKHDDLARKLTALEDKYDRQFKVVFDAIRQLMAPGEDAPRERIGFHSKADKLTSKKRDSRGKAWDSKSRIS